MSSKSKILLIYTGGTIGMSKDFETGALKAFNFSKLLQRIPELKLLDCEIETISFENPIDSSNMNPEKWQDLEKGIPDMFGMSEDQMSKIAPFARDFKCKDALEKGDPTCDDKKYSDGICP